MLAAIARKLIVKKFGSRTVNLMMISKKLLLWLIVFLYTCLLGACAPSSSVDRERFFFPPLPAEPKIEYLKSYFSDYDLKSGKKSFMTEFVLGENPPDRIFLTPVDVASNGNGRVYVTDQGHRRVLVLDMIGQRYQFLPEAEGSILPYGVTVAEDKRIYVVDALAKQVSIYDENEIFLLSCVDEDFNRPVAVAVDVGNEHIYVVDTAAHRVSVFNTRCDFIEHFGQRGAEPGTLNYPTDIDVDKEGNIYILDSLNARIQVFDKERNFLRMFGERGTAEGSFQIPKNLAVSELGHLYVTDALAHKVIIFSTEGDLLLRIGGKSVVKDGISPGGFYSPRGVATDQNGGLWVVDVLNRMVHRFQFLTPEYLRDNPVPKNVMQVQ
jgi:DNA-binding beta-propeller fold protein YncE